MDLRQRKEIPDDLNDDEVLIVHKKKPKEVSNSIIKYCVIGICLGFVVIAGSLAFFLSSPSPNYPVPYELPYPPTLEGVLSPNDKLARGKRYLEGEIHGPEFLIFRHGLLYTGTSDGKILEISKDGKMRTVARLGKEPCGGPLNEPTCGRPLGMEFDADGYLVVCDAYLGIFRIDVTSGDVQEILPKGEKFNFLNDLEITMDGEIYFTQSSMNYQRNNYMMDILHGGGSGRLLKFDPIRGAIKVVLHGLFFPNGILLSEFEDYVLISETRKARILKHHVKGFKTGTTEVFSDNLPCFPDNLHEDPKTLNIWVACSHLRHSKKFINLFDALQGHTWIRRILMELPMDKVSSRMNHGAMLLEINREGRVLQALMDLDSKVAGRLSHVTMDEEGNFYAGSYVDDFLVVVGREELKVDQSK